MKKVFDLKEWTFKVDGLGIEKTVTLPHTWNVDDNLPLQLYRGNAEYTTLVTAEAVDGKKAVLYFGCAYHTARVYVNGSYAGIHTGSGYTPFELDVTQYIKSGENEIRVSVDNYKSKDMLPYLLNFDWADDGGLTRNTTLTLYDSDDITDMSVRYDITNIGGETCDGVFKITADAPPRDAELTVTEYKTGKEVISKSVALGAVISVPFDGLKIWTPDSPNLYVITLKCESCEISRRTGLRTVEVNGAKVLLNGKEIYLKGCEWMPGSDPAYGMAEPYEISVKYLSMLKNAGCVFTRFHWQQDTSLFDWCDENGLLVQEEIPYWGCPKKAGKAQLEIAKRQADEMIKYHSHHPSIVCWGVGNELGGRKKQTVQYVKDMYSYFKAKDPSRLVNYVSNTLPVKKKLTEKDFDATLCGDIAMWNDYLGLWLKSKNIKEDILKAYKKCGNMPSVISEFGLCEPFFKGGDERRGEILKSRVELYKTLPGIVGYVWFSLNDYRTHCGEEGKGKLKRRVHGSADLYGNPKPSYEILKKI